MEMRHEGTVTSVTQPALIIDKAHYQRLLEVASRARKTLPRLAAQLLEEIERADLRQSTQMPASVIRVGSEVTFLDNDTGRTHAVELVYPQDADIDRHRVSLLTPVGAALLGLSIGQEIAWEMNDGRLKRLTVLDVTQITGGVTGSH
jgi:regulator of nucleoside diphosphate kinase